MSNASVSHTHAPTAPAPQAHSKVVIVAILLLLGCSYMFNAMDRQVFPALIEPIRAQYGLTLPQAGFLNTAFAALIAVFGGMSGWFMARFGRRWTLVGGLITCSIFTLLTPFSVSFYDLAGYRMMSGTGEALHLGAIFAMVGAYFGANRGFAIGMVNAFFGVGSFLGPFLGPRLYMWTGSWGLPFYFFGIVGIIIALVVLFFVPADICDAVDTEKAPVSAPSAEKFFNRNVVLCALSLFLYGYAFFSYVAMFTSYARNGLGYSVVEAGTAFSGFGIGGLTAVVGGWLSDKLKRTGHLCVLAGLAIVGFALFHGVSSHFLQFLLNMAYGVICGGYLYPRFLATLQRSVKAEQVGYAMGLAIPTFYGPGLIVGYLFGLAVVAFGWSIASTICVFVPAVIGFVVLCFYDEKQMRGA